MCFLCFLVLSLLAIIVIYCYCYRLPSYLVRRNCYLVLHAVAIFIIVVIIICRFPPTFLDLQSHAQAAVIGAYNVLTQEIGSRYFDNNERLLYFCHEKMWEMIQVQVALPSGKRKTLAIEESSKVGDLKILAQKTFGLSVSWGLSLHQVMSWMILQGHNLQGFKMETTSQLLCITQSSLQPNQHSHCGAVEVTGLWPGGIDAVVVIALQLNIAAILADGSVVAWGEPEDRGDSSAVQHQLRNVQQVQANCLAFAAILADGSVVTWGDSTTGGDSSPLQDQLTSVRQLQSTKAAFAAILADGSVVTWGDPQYGGDSSALQSYHRHTVDRPWGMSSRFNPQKMHLLPS